MFLLFVCVALWGQKSIKQQMRIQEGHFLNIALNLDLTLSDDGECPTFFDSLWNYRFRCFLRRVMVIFRQQKKFGPNVIYFVVGTSGGTTPGPGPNSINYNANYNYNL